MQFVLGVAGSDVHCVANQLIERELKFQGLSVINLGVALSSSEIVNSLESLSDPVLLLGTLNGDLDPTVLAITAVRETYGSDIPIIVGGSFVLGETGKDRTIDLMNVGADIVIKNSLTVEDSISQVLVFLGNRKATLFSKT